jgi:hypothetical protein
MTRARDVADMITHDHEASLTYVKTTGNAAAGQVAVTGLTYTAGFVDVYLNGVKLVIGSDVTATNGKSITLAKAASAGDLIQVTSYSTTGELATQLLSADGGSASETYTSEQTINGGAASG